LDGKNARGMVNKYDNTNLQSKRGMMSCGVYREVSGTAMKTVV